MLKPFSVLAFCSDGSKKLQPSSQVVLEARWFQPELGLMVATPSNTPSHVHQPTQRKRPGEAGHVLGPGHIGSAHDEDGVGTSSAEVGASGQYKAGAKAGKRSKGRSIFSTKGQQQGSGDVWIPLEVGVWGLEKPAAFDGFWPSLPTHLPAQTAHR